MPKIEFEDLGCLTEPVGKCKTTQTTASPHCTVLYYYTYLLSTSIRVEPNRSVVTVAKRLAQVQLAQLVQLVSRANVVFAVVLRVFAPQPAASSQWPRVGSCGSL